MRPWSWWLAFGVSLVGMARFGWGFLWVVGVIGLVMRLGHQEGSARGSH
jgi:hypothetical protein